MFQRKKCRSFEINRRKCRATKGKHLRKPDFQPRLSPERLPQNLSQEEFAERAGVALTVIRKTEQGKSNLNLEKVNQVLHMFGHVLVPISSKALIQKMEMLKNKAYRNIL